MEHDNILTNEQTDLIIKILKTRFTKNVQRHPELLWEHILKKLEKTPGKLWSLSEMERTGGEPDVIGYDEVNNIYLYVDCSPESPKGRRSLCYDREAQESRKDFPPENNALDMAASMGIELLTEEEYRLLQQYGDFDSKTSSWLKTPGEIRQLGGAIFADFRYNQVFIYHNSAPSYYATRGFRGILKV